MRAARRLVATLGVAAAALGLAGCADGGGADRLVGVAMPTTTLERWVSDGEDVRDQLEAFGYDVDLRYAENDVALQVEQVGDMIDDGVSLLVVGSIDGGALTEQLARAAAAGIPVLAYDRLIVGSPDVAYYATFDNFRVGVLQGTSLLRELGAVAADGTRVEGAGPFTIEMFAGSPDDNNATVFYEGAMSVLEPFLADGTLVVGSGEKELGRIGTPGWDAAVAQERMTALLAAHYAGGARPDGVLAPNDGIAGAVRAALADRGGARGVALTGQDADVDGVRAVVAGEQSSTIYKDTRLLAELAVAMGHTILSGGEPETNDVTSYHNGVEVVPTMLLAPQLVTAADVDRVLVASGAFTAEELR